MVIKALQVAKAHPALPAVKVLLARPALLVLLALAVKQARLAHVAMMVLYKFIFKLPIRAHRALEHFGLNHKISRGLLYASLLSHIRCV